MSLSMLSVSRVPGTSCRPGSRLAAAAPVALVSVLGASACAEDDLEGVRYLVDLVGVEDNCNEELASYGESFEYRVVTSGASADIYLGETVMASGTLNGCELDYSSALFTDDREEGVVRWLLEGTATVDLGGALCEAGSGWVGSETIKVIDSSDAAVPTGCTYVMDATGSRIGG